MHRQPGILLSIGIALLWILVLDPPAACRAQEPSADGFERVVSTLASLGDRSTGTPGCRAAAAFIKKEFSKLGFDQVGTLRFSVPVRVHEGSSLIFPDRNITFPIKPLISNAITPETISSPGIEGPLVYVGAGELSDFNGKAIKGAVILMELESGKNWLHAANLGAKALIYVDRGPTPNVFFKEKYELSPIQFPRFWIPYQKIQAFFGSFEAAPEGLLSPRIRMISKIKWKNVDSENLYALMTGSDPKLTEELVIVEAFYDSTSKIPGHSPGADEACSIATLLDLARFLKQKPSKRSVLLIATSGHAQTLAGMRELIWSINARSKDQRKIKKTLKNAASRARKVLKALDKMSFDRPSSAASGQTALNRLVKEAIDGQIKNEEDVISRRLMRLRMQQTGDADKDIIETLAKKRLLLRRLEWRASFQDLSLEETEMLNRLIPWVLHVQKAVLSDATKQLKQLKSVRSFRALVKAKELSAVISLHLSSNGDGFGAFNRGWLYPLKPRINRVSAYSTLDEAMHRGASEVALSLNDASMFKDTLRPSRRRSWRSYFLDRPPLGGEVSSIAGYLGISLVTTNDARSMWGTPYDTPERVNRAYASAQSDFVCGLVKYLTEAPGLQSGTLPRNGFSTVTCRANFLRYGELFADQPAPGSMILAYQGPARYHAMVDTLGTFRLKGVADKKHVLGKVIIEGYRFDPVTGDVIWAIDKKQTGKPAYRIKMQRRAMETDLVMFACRQTTLFNLLEPRSFNYMHKIQIIDGRREATPLRWWVSRADTRSSTIMSTYLEPGTRLKMTFSDTVLRKKMILTNTTESKPAGTGYPVEKWPFLYLTEFRTARDMWGLLEPRIANLENHGIFNERIRKLQQEGTLSLKNAEQALEARLYSRFSEAAAKSWALASRVYDHVEKTQKDVLFGVLFYIAMFVPFAFCLERLLFCYSDIYKRIIAFCSILILLIAVIYKVHPAFQLAYSPMVVILAFFIIGLSFMVTLIIFFRFEQEMILLQSRAKHVKTGEISRWKAFMAAFFLGVSNLRRRRLRTALTCATLIILTFTIMSFTTVKTMRHHSRLLYQSSAPYQGFLLKNINWRDLPPEALGIISNAFAGKGVVAPRVWLEDEDKTRSTCIPVRYKNRIFEAQGLVGLSAGEVHVTGLDAILVAGRWLEEKDRQSVLLPLRMAKNLGIDLERARAAVVYLWGMPFNVAGIFSSKKLQQRTDLDGEPLTPVIFPRELSTEMTEVEMEALESGEDVQTFQSRYQHLPGDLTVIVPHEILLAAGGHLKGVAVRPEANLPVQSMAQNLVDRFGLALFSGEPEGTFLYNVSDTLSYSGVPNIVIPLIISVFIVLNTMIGSVYERKREIGIYTSVGLAPSHVSFLFIAEATAFAVLSVVLGYLLAQTTANLFAGSTLWAGITVNYSSLAGVGAMLLVILVVLVSVVYPSRVAAEIAIPDVNRSWKLPEAKDNALEMTLPFLMKYREHQGVGGYIFDYFNGHRDVSHGLFSTGDVDLAFVCPVSHGIDKERTDCAGTESCDSTCLRLRSKVWLAPFDFGIMQNVDVQFCPAGEETGFLEIKIRLVRESGEINAWRRINRAFLHALRKQLLIWRSLDDTIREHYGGLLVGIQMESGE